MVIISQTFISNHFLIEIWPMLKILIVKVFFLAFWGGFQAFQIQRKSVLKPSKMILKSPRNTQSMFLKSIKILQGLQWTQFKAKKQRFQKKIKL